MDKPKVLIFSITIVLLCPFFKCKLPKRKVNDRSIDFYRTTRTIKDCWNVFRGELIMSVTK